ncbi:hypothetical protein HY992_02960 [Candidatus Micrarchaeota archaeon]|nr:hypothetical protein [Candidatus Micrarchaeota archaeon]
MQDKRQSKGAIVSIDAFLALLLLALVFTIGFVATKTLAERYALAEQESTTEMTLIAFADKLVKEEATRSDNERVFQHEVESSKAKNLDLNKWKNNTGLKELSVEAMREGKRVASMGSRNASNCIKRLALVDGKIGAVRVCG